jgi:putative ABC transport system permease protein
MSADRHPAADPGAGTAWLFRMAWRESRRNRSRLFLFVSSIILGIAALVSIYGLGENLRREVDLQAAELIGADIAINANRDLSPDMQRLVDSLGDRRSEQRSFPSMAYFPAGGHLRLVQVRALAGDFPYYGRLRTEPEAAGSSFRTGQAALVDKSLMDRFGARPGDTVRLGERAFRIEGALLAAPGQTGMTAAVAPVVYIPMRHLAATGLDRKGSRIARSHFIRFDRPVDVPALVKALEPRFEREQLDVDTVESQKEKTARSFGDLTRFLSLVGFIALLLGCIGVASAVHILIRERIATIAVLRCLGATARQAFLIQLIQVSAVGIVGSAAGAALGTAIQQGMPLLLEDLLPIQVETRFSAAAIGQGLLTGLVVSVLFALAPLVSIRNISPLNTLRVDKAADAGRDPLRWLVYLLIAAFVLGFSALQLKDWGRALAFTLGVGAAFLLLAGTAKLLMRAVRRFFPHAWPYVWRQGLANLYRPNNQTAVILLSVGLGTALICTVVFIRGILLDRVGRSASGNQPNMVLFDIRSSQRDTLLGLARRHGMPADGTVPIVTLRLEAVNGIGADDLARDSTIDMQRWIFTREYRVTFRDTLTPTERVAKGAWTGRWAGGQAPVYVSLERKLADRNHIRIGDTLTFDVQGVRLRTLVGSLRDVEWTRVQTNFLVVFPSGVLEQAPQFHVLVTRAPDTRSSAAFQQAVVRDFPNISVIDLGLVLDIVDDILRKIGTVIRFMAMFCLCTGIVVLIASVMISRYQRMREGVLLRTLGADRRQVLAINGLEYLFLGALAGLTGVLIAMAGSWALARFVFETDFRPDLSVALQAFAAVCALTVGIGLANSRFVVNRPPLEILREE